MMLEPIDRLSPRHEEQGRRSLERSPHAVDIGVRRGHGYLRARDRGSTVSVAHDQSLGDAPLAEASGDAPTDLPRATRDRDLGVVRDVVLPGSSMLTTLMDPTLVPSPQGKRRRRGWRLRCAKVDSSVAPGAG
jgi:hypothetical protein